MDICWNDHLGTFHSLFRTPPPKNGRFLNRVAQILLQRSRKNLYPSGIFFKGADKKLILQISFPKGHQQKVEHSDSSHFYQGGGGVEVEVQIIHLLSIRFHVWFHVAFDDVCSKQNPKVQTSVLCHIQCLYELRVDISSSR